MMHRLLCAMFVGLVLPALAEPMPVDAQRASALMAQGRAAEPGNPASGADFEAKVALAEKSGDYFAQAFEISHDAIAAENAGGQYMRVFDWTRVGQWQYGLFKDVQLPVLRERAAVWLKKAMAMGSARSWTDYGVLLISEGDVDGARAAFEKGAEQDIAVAHQHLGKMDERRNTADALAHYERALALGYKPARADVYRLLIESLQYESDLEVLGKGVNRLNELYEDEDDSTELNSLIERYNWRSFLVWEKGRGRRLPDLPIYLKACELDKKFNPQRIQAFYPGGYWTLHMAGAELDDPFEIQGKIDRAGCAALAKPLPEEVRAMLNVGGVTYLSFPTGALLLDWKVRGKEIHLVPRPMKEQIPPV